MNKILMKLLSTLLCMAMFIALLPAEIFASADYHGAEAAEYLKSDTDETNAPKLSLVCIESDGDSENPKPKKNLTGQYAIIEDPVTLPGDSSFFIGIKADNFTQFLYNDEGIGILSTGIAYDPDYVEWEPTVEQGKAGAFAERLNDEDKFDFANGIYSLQFYASKNTESDANVSENCTKTAIMSILYDANDMQYIYKLPDSDYIGFMEFKVKKGNKSTAKGKSVFEISGSPTDTAIQFGNNASHTYTYHSNNPLMQMDNSGADVFPQKAEISLEIMKYKDGVSYETEENIDSDVPLVEKNDILNPESLTQGTEILVGVKMKNITNIDIGSDGMFSYSMEIKYNTEYLAYSDHDMGSLNMSLQSRLGNLNPNNIFTSGSDVNYRVDNQGSSIEQAGTIRYALASVGNKMLYSDDEKYIAVFRFTLAKDAPKAAVKDVIKLDTASTDFNISFGEYGSSGSYQGSSNDSSYEITNIFYLDQTSVDIFGKIGMPDYDYTNTDILKDVDDGDFDELPHLILEPVAVETVATTNGSGTKITTVQSDDKETGDEFYVGIRAVNFDKFVPLGEKGISMWSWGVVYDSDVLEWEPDTGNLSSPSSMLDDRMDSFAEYYEDTYGKKTYLNSGGGYNFEGYTQKDTKNDINEGNDKSEGMKVINLICMANQMNNLTKEISSNDYLAVIKFKCKNASSDRRVLALSQSPLDDGIVFGSSDSVSLTWNGSTHLEKYLVLDDSALDFTVRKPEKGKLEMVYLKQSGGQDARLQELDENDTFGDVILREDGSIGRADGLHEGDSFWVGVKISNLKKLKNFDRSQSFTGLINVAFGLIYDSEYLCDVYDSVYTDGSSPKPLPLTEDYSYVPGIMAGENAGVVNSLLPYMNVDSAGHSYSLNPSGVHNTYSINDGSNYNRRIADEYKLNGAEDTTSKEIFVNFWKTVSNTDGIFDADSAVLAVMRFKVKKVPESGSKVFGFENNNTTLVMGFSTDNTGIADVTLQNNDSDTQAGDYQHYMELPTVVDPFSEVKEKALIEAVIVEEDTSAESGFKYKEAELSEPLKENDTVTIGVRAKNLENIEEIKDNIPMVDLSMGLTYNPEYLLLEPDMNDGTLNISDFISTLKQRLDGIELLKSDSQGYTYELDASNKRSELNPSMSTLIWFIHSKAIDSGEDIHIDVPNDTYLGIFKFKVKKVPENGMNVISFSEYESDTVLKFQSVEDDIEKTYQYENLDVPSDTDIMQVVEFNDAKLNLFPQGQKKAKLKMTLLTPDVSSADNSGFKAVPSGKIQKSSGNDLYVGIMAEDFENIKEVYEYEEDAHGGLNDISCALAYDSRYLKIEPDCWEDDVLTGVSAVWDSRMDFENSILNKNEPYKYRYVSEMIDEIDADEEDKEKGYTKQLAVSLIGGSAGAERMNYSGADGCYLAIVKFRIIDDISSLNDKKIVGFSSDPSFTSMSFGLAGDDKVIYQLSGDGNLSGTVKDFGAAVDFDDADMIFYERNLTGVTLEIDTNKVYGDKFSDTNPVLTFNYDNDESVIINLDDFEENGITAKIIDKKNNEITANKDTLLKCAMDGGKVQLFQNGTLLAQSATLTVSQKLLTVQRIGNVPEYSGELSGTQTLELTGENSDILGNDKVTLTYKYEYSENDIKQTGSPEVTITADGEGLGLSGDDAENYRLKTPLPSANGSVTVIDETPPEKPVLTVSSETNNIIVTAPTGENIQYSIDGQNWQEGTEFTNLEKDTEYTVRAREKDALVYSENSIKTFKNHLRVYKKNQDINTTPVAQIYTNETEAGSNDYINTKIFARKPQNWKAYYTDAAASQAIKYPYLLQPETILYMTVTSASNHKSSVTPEPTLTPEATPSPSDAPDVKPTPSDEPVIKNDYQKPYASGYSDGTFAPDSNITRAELASMIARLVYGGDIPDGEYSSQFSDVRSDAWYDKYIGYLEELDILSGYEDGLFRPEIYVTRKELCSVITRAQKFDIMPYSGEFNDVDVYDWASGYIATLAYKSIIKGYDDGTFRPKNNLTRAETVTMINKLFVPCAPIVTFTPVDISSHWANAEILLAVNEREMQN